MILTVLFGYSIIRREINKSGAAIKRLIRLGLSNEVDIKPPEGMTDCQLKVFLSMFRKIAEKSSKEEIIAELDKMIENL